MTQTEFIAACQATFQKNSIECTNEQAISLFSLTERMLTVNKSMNLTAITDENEIILRHYVDSVTISPHINPNASLIDIGCGAGFPTLPLAIFRPDLAITALDGTAKRIHYVHETAKELGLNNALAIAGRAEEYAGCPDYREQFDYATARAVANLQVLCELTLPFVKTGGALIAMKSQRAEEELSQAKNCIKLCGGEIENVLSCNLYSESGSEERKLIIIKKIQQTPKIYPRHFSKISKKPL